MPPLRPCLGLPGQPCATLTTGRRCPSCSTPLERARTQAKREARPYTAAERRRRAKAVALWRREYGDLCPGYADDPPHEATPDNPLTADHIQAVAAGGLEQGDLAILCRKHNSIKGTKIENM